MIYNFNAHQTPSSVLEDKPSVYNTWDTLYNLKCSSHSTVRILHRSLIRVSLTAYWKDVHNTYDGMYKVHIFRINALQKCCLRDALWIEAKKVCTAWYTYAQLSFPEVFLCLLRGSQFGTRVYQIGRD